LVKRSDKKAENESVIAELQQQANDKFSLNEWLPDAAKRVLSFLWLVIQVNLVIQVPKLQV
jgi:hypothetical protein